VDKEIRILYGDKERDEKGREKTLDLTNYLKIVTRRDKDELLRRRKREKEEFNSLNLN